MTDAKKRLSDQLLGLERSLNDTAAKHPHFAKRLHERNMIAQIKLRDDSMGRYYIFKNGQVHSESGIHPDADAMVWFDNAETALAILKPDRNQLEYISAIKSFQMGMPGPDEPKLWFWETLSMMVTAPITFGTDMGDGVTRYTSNTNGGPVFVYVKDDKILRITPIYFDEEDADPWVIEAKGKKYSPPKKATVDSYTQAWKSMVYSKERLLYPMRRVDFDSNGERNPQNRGISGYERISWEEALDLVTSEIRRMKRDYGPGAILNGSGSHHTWGYLGYWLSLRLRFFNQIGFTPVDHNPDSWEGWFWGASHHWGQIMRRGGGETYGTLEDCMKNCEMIVFWSSDPEATSGLYSAHEGTIRRQWLNDLGIKVVHIDPYYNHTAAYLGGKWIAPKVGTDVAMILAIAYTWIKEDLYDKKYVADRTVGFEKWKSYILGEVDGIEKTPEWQEAETGVPAKTVRALAREWGTKKTYLSPGGIVGFGGACRASTGPDWARGLVMLMAMQGLGKPGINLGSLQQGAPVDTRFYIPGYSEGGFSGDINATANGVNLYQRMPQLASENTVRQMIPRLKLPEAIMEGKCETNFTDSKVLEGQFFEYKYPAPGHSPVKMYYKYGGSHFGTMTDTNRYVKMYQSENLEFVVNQSIWMEGETKFADIILPACTSFERWDFSEFANCGGYIHQCYTQVNSRVAVLQHKCIEPLGESRSDFQIFYEIAKRLGYGFNFSEGSTEFDWCKRLFDGTDLPKAVQWEDFCKKGYYVVPPLPEDRRDPVSYNWFAEDRAKDTPEMFPMPGDYTEEFPKGLQTQSGKLEFESSSLKRYDPDDPERPPVLTYIPSWEGPHSTELLKKYPMQLVSPHPRFSFHTMGDGKDSTINDVKDHRVLIDGHYYWIARVNPEDAAARGIKENDLIKVYNDRGAVICAAQVSARIRPGVVHSYESCAIYEPVGKPGYSPDRGGCINNLTPSRMIIKKSHGMAVNSCLVDVAKWDGKETVL
jgi:trimethylamine-N-oxide reductase (cytochrome c)